MVAIVIDNPGENYPAKDNPDPDNTGLIDVIVTIGGTGYTIVDPIVIPGISTTGTVFIPDLPTVIPPEPPEGGGDPIPPTPQDPPPADTPGPLVPPGVIGIGTTTPIFEIEIGEGGEISDVKVINIQAKYHEKHSVAKALEQAEDEKDQKYKTSFSPEFLNVS